MKKKVICLLLIVCTAISLSAQWNVSEELELEYWMPEEWEKSNDEGVSIISSPDGNAEIYYISIDEDDIDSAIDIIEDELTYYFEEIKITEEPHEININGMHGVLAGGEAIMDETNMIWKAVIIFRRDQALLVLGFGNKDTIDTHLPALEAMIHELRPFMGEQNMNEWLTHPKANVEFWVPGPWPIRPNPDFILVQSPDEMVSVFYRALKGEDVEFAIEQIEIELDERFDDVEILQEPEVIFVNRLEAVISRGIATLDGEKMVWAAVVYFNQDRALLAFGFGYEEMIEEHLPALDFMIHAVRPVRGPGGKPPMPPPPKR